ncbi:hypothetical protein PHMEG_00030724, partial [Phytophthora megakarya]
MLMPLWELDKLIDPTKYLKQDLTEETIRKRVVIFGGVPKPEDSRAFDAYIASEFVSRLVLEKLTTSVDKIREALIQILVRGASFRAQRMYKSEKSKSEPTKPDQKNRKSEKSKAKDE